MEFDWTRFDPLGITKKEIEESFEDPFGIRLMPDIEEAEGREPRYFNLGRAISPAPLFTVFWTDGKIYRVIFSRRMTTDEEGFYDRKNSEANQ